MTRVEGLFVLMMETIKRSCTHPVRVHDGHVDCAHDVLHTNITTASIPADACWHVEPWDDLHEDFPVWNHGTLPDFTAALLQMIVSQSDEHIVPLPVVKDDGRIATHWARFDSEQERTRFVVDFVTKSLLSNLVVHWSDMIHDVMLLPNSLQWPAAGLKIQCIVVLVDFLCGLCVCFCLIALD